MTRLSLGLLLAMVLSACVSREELLARDRQTCTEIGFAPDSADYRNCILQLEAARLHGYHHGY